LWHERDISHSSAERVILPDSTILVDYLLVKTTDLIDRLLVYPDRMKENLETGGGLIFSGQLLLDLAAKGVLREQAYRWVQRNAMRAWEENGNFRALVEQDADNTSILTPEDIPSAFTLNHQLRHVDQIFERVFPTSAKS
jgi:adenylosuccinate lyase